MIFELKINEKLSLKERQTEDAQELFDLVDKNRERLRVYMPWIDSTLSVKDTEEYILKNIEKHKEVGNVYDFGICYENKWIGNMGYHDVSKSNQKACIGYWLDEDFEGRGIMTECVKALIKYGFKELNLNRVEIGCDVNNSKSRAIPERLGFKLEGTLRQDHKRNGTFRDSFVFGLLKEEWMNN